MRNLMYYLTAFILTLLFALTNNSSYAALTDIRFGQYQVADSQWNVQACTQTTTCQIYSKNPGVAYRIPWTSGQLSWAAGDYIRFEISGIAGWPYTARQYSSNGTIKATLGVGKIVNIGPDYFFFVGNDNNTGQLFSGSSGMSSTAGVTWTGTLNPTIQQADAIADANYSTVPLSPGQNATSTPNSGGGGAAPAQPTYSSTITVGQQQSYDYAIIRRNTIGGNTVYLDQQAGSSNNSITIQQYSSNNSVSGRSGQQYATISGSGNNITVRQGDPANIVGKNLVELQLQGSNNTVEINQARIITTGAADGWDSNGHIASVKITGSGNVFRTQQTNTTAGPHYMEVDLGGNNNNTTFRQLGDGTKRLWSNVNGSSNTLNILQGDAGNHYLDLSLTGNGHTVTVTQRNSGSHSATINLVNAGGSSNLTLLQQGNTNQVYSISQQCANLSGCSVSVTQGTGP